MHRARPFDPFVNQTVPYTHLGLYSIAGEPRKSIALGRIELREQACSTIWPR